jgi:hypothetical protein
VVDAECPVDIEADAARPGLFRSTLSGALMVIILICLGIYIVAASALAILVGHFIRVGRGEAIDG